MSSVRAFDSSSADSVEKWLKDPNTKALMGGGGSADIGEILNAVYPVGWQSGLYAEAGHNNTFQQIFDSAGVPAVWENKSKTLRGSGSTSVNINCFYAVRTA